MIFFFPYYVSEKNVKIRKTIFFFPYFLTFLSFTATWKQQKSNEKKWGTDKKNMRKSSCTGWTWDKACFLVWRYTHKKKDRNLGKNKEQKAKEVVRNGWITILDKTSGQLDTRQTVQMKWNVWNIRKKVSLN